MGLSAAVDIADRVFGRGNHVITSNNDANDHIRLKMGIRNIPLVGISLPELPSEHIASLGNIIMAISTSQFGEESYFASVARTKADGFKTESHADSFDDF